MGFGITSRRGLILAEPLMRRTLEIDEKSYGPDHPKVARDPEQPGATVAGYQSAPGGKATLPASAANPR
jgi:hypothetical protein